MVTLELTERELAAVAIGLTELAHQPLTYPREAAAATGILRRILPLLGVGR